METERETYCAACGGRVVRNEFGSGRCDCGRTIFLAPEWDSEDDTTLEDQLAAELIANDGLRQHEAFIWRAIGEQGSEFHEAIDRRVNELRQGWS